jgi:hypothetical protein
VVITTSWEVETDAPGEAILKSAVEGVHFSEEDRKNFRLLKRLDRLKDKPKKIRLGEFKPEEIIPYITREDEKREYVIDGKKYAVRMNSHRYFIFRESLTCAACGLIGTKMILEQHPADKSPHFNLYGVENGKLILMTKDHIQAKAYGGEDRHSNYQTMCVVCNNLKGSSCITLDGIRELRKIYDAHHDRATKKELYQLVLEAKARLAKPRCCKKISAKQRHVHAADQKGKEQEVIATCDINIWRAGRELIGKSVYEKSDGQHIACIKKGTVLTPCGASGRKVIIGLDETQQCTVAQGLLDYKENLDGQEEIAPGVLQCPGENGHRGGKAGGDPPVLGRVPPA